MKTTTERSFTLNLANAASQPTGSHAHLFAVFGLGQPGFDFVSGDVWKAEAAEAEDPHLVCLGCAARSDPAHSARRAETK